MSSSNEPSVITNLAGDRCSCGRKERQQKTQKRQRFPAELEERGLEELIEMHLLLGKCIDLEEGKARETEMPPWT